MAALLRQMRKAARVNARNRRADVRRRVELGGAVIAADLGECETAEIVGLLLGGRKWVGGSSAMRIGMRKRGEAALGGNNGASGQPSTVPTLH
jgi:hypothetical protein